VTDTLADRQARGRSNRRRGTEFMRRLAAWLRDNGAPYADLTTRAHASDLTGVGDLAIEATTEPWERIGGKMRQSADDAARRGLTEYCVVKSRRGFGVGEAWFVQPWAQAWRQRLELEELRNHVLVLRKELRERDREGVAL